MTISTSLLLILACAQVESPLEPDGPPPVVTPAEETPPDQPMESPATEPAPAPADEPPTAAAPSVADAGTPAQGVQRTYRSTGERAGAVARRPKAARFTPREPQ